ncbi:MAG: phosphoribosylamine--glycine ligase [Sphaerochaetaceae bacterium]|jgi:phosphoribosylamine--glycine ligase
MKILVLGSGAKDHAIAWWFSQSKLIDGLFYAPSNPGVEGYAVNLPQVDPSNGEQVYEACRQHDIDLVFIGTENPIFAGVVDYLEKKGQPTFGAPGYAIKLEGDRTFSRAFMKRHGIPCPQSILIKDEDQLESFLASKDPSRRIILKTNTMSPSRSLFESTCSSTLRSYAKTLLKGGPILAESHVSGLAVSATLLLDKSGGYLELPFSSDYTKSEENETGPATGGMGSICPIPLRSFTLESLQKQIIEPTIKGLREEGLCYNGVLTLSIIVDDITQSPTLVDYHVRFNDPATQAIIPTVENDIVSLIQLMLDNRISEARLQTNNKSTVSVVLASKGYPDSPELGVELSPIAPLVKANCLDSMPMLFFGAVKKDEDGVLKTTGGRCLTVVGCAKSIIEANSQAYSITDSIAFPGSWYRKDIGNRFFES